MNVEFINPGDLDRRITIIRPYRSYGAEGQEIVDRRPIAERWASVDIDASDEDLQDGNVRSVHWLDITMYQLPIMMTGDELEFEGRRYNITSINEVRLTPFVKVRAREVLRYD
ncbi:MAG: head-tail adaptor protein [Bacteroidales bacterium]|nr:head-tail adaptor protein [Bacteroidales bacterium]